MKFNLAALLIRGEANVRGIALKNSALRAEKYFEKAEDVVQRLPDIIARLESGGDVSNELSVIMKSLEDIGFKRPANASAGELNKIYKGLIAAYSEKGWRNLYYIDADKEDLTSLTLAKLLFLLDKAEQSRKPRILAVDDVSVVLSAISAVLEKDYEVFCLTRAEQVEKFLMHTMPDLFLLDIEMPNINGHELIKIIRSFDEHKDTPIMFLTGNATVKNFQAAMAQGVADFISKPVDPAVLLKKVQERINKKAF
jgi:CheY-like chemotaxis protein